MSTVDKEETVREQICVHTTASLLTPKWRQLHNGLVQKTRLFDRNIQVIGIATPYRLS